MTAKRGSGWPVADTRTLAAADGAVASADAPPDLPQSETLARAAWLYYVEGMTQEEIARVLASNRARVNALLASARDVGLVRVRIEPRTSRSVALEHALCVRFDLQEAVVAPAPIDAASTAVVVGHAAGCWLGDQLRDGLSIGIGWGRTLEMSLKAIGDDAAFQRISVVSLLGSLPHSGAITPATVARRLADELAADCFQLTAPLLVSDAATRDALWREPGLADLKRHATRVDLALVSVGELDRRATLFHERVIPAQDLETLARAGAVGDVLGQFIDVDGRRVDHPVNRRVLALGLDALSRLPNVAIASGGARKVPALRAALAAVRPRTLITDETAAELLVR